MDEARKRQILNTLTGSGDSDEVLDIYLARAKELMLNILFPTEHDRESLDIPAQYEMKQLEIAEYLLNKRGAEGETQHTEGQVRRYFGSSDVPEAMIRHMTPFVGVVK